MADASKLIPEITEEDIEWVCNLMQLETPDEPRRIFLTSRYTLDVSACPGSGKTTLVVAKLAILARKWPHQTKGICVLSHTNAAREEIQGILGNTVIGQRLLGYPHYVDTIHGFVNRFLALPWLNSNGYPSPTIDNGVTAAYRRRVLSKRDYGVLRSYLDKRHSSLDSLRICARDLSFDLGGKAFPAGSSAPSFHVAKHAVESAARAGYFCHDEMFVWARALLEDFPGIACWLRCRFPFVLLDEMQDTFEIQGRILHSVFPRTSPDVIVQRVGDPNQMIFDDADSMPDESDPFPDNDPLRKLSIPNSYRFGPEIAALASPFAVEPVGTAGLCGIGPRFIAGESHNCGNTVFVFPDNSTSGVLDAYGEHVLETFDDWTLAKGKVTAIGAVHQDALDINPGHKHFPKSVQNYWGGYQAEIARKEPHPRSLVQYIRVAQTSVRDSHNVSPGIDRFASGLVRLADLIGNASNVRRTARMHRMLVEALETDGATLGVYCRMVRAILVDQMPVTEDNWAKVRVSSLRIASALCEGSTNHSNATDFVQWSTDELSSAGSTFMLHDEAGPNVYRVSDGTRYVDIRLGSIHSVKGQTHLATLVLSTYWHAQSSERVLPWLLGEKVNGYGAQSQDRKRLLQTYVAMTRPSHMICLAVPLSVFGNSSIYAKRIATLISRGWRVAEITDGSIKWRV